MKNGIEIDKKGCIVMSTIAKKEFQKIGIITFDYNNQVISVNEAALDNILKETADQTIGKSIISLLPLTEKIQTFLRQDKMLEYTTQLKIKELHVDLQFLKDLKSETTTCVIVPKTKRDMIEQISLERILDSCLDEIFITDGDGNVMFINQAGQHLYGVPPEELIGKNVLELEKEGYYSPSLFPIAKNRKEKVSMIQRTKTGKTTHCIAYPSYNNEGELINVVFNARDITEIKYLREKIERSTSILDTFKTELNELKNLNQIDENFIALSPNMKAVNNMMNKIAPFDTTILITGESGVGKGVITQQIHDRSQRKDFRIVHINCGAIPEALIEAELFGYDSGAFTGAKKEGSVGLIEQAHKGTLFLDEIGEMPLDLQVKLLKVIQERKVTPVGSSRTIDVDIRIIAATNRNLEEQVKEGTFREDLYYRLNVIPIHIPPLRTRPEDVSMMIDNFLQAFNEKYHTLKELSLEAENTLHRYQWPGNVRELENVMERLVVTTDTNEIVVEDIPVNILNEIRENAVAIEVKNIVTLKQAQEQMEEQLIRKAYEIDTSSYKVAKMLGINQSTAHRKISQYIKND